MNKIKNIKEIDYVKALAILSVWILHLWLWKEIDKKYLFYLYTVIGVPIFMIIIGHNYTLSFEFNNKVCFSRNNIYIELKRIVLPYIYIIRVNFNF